MNEWVSKWNDGEGKFMLIIHEFIFISFVNNNKKSAAFLFAGESLYFTREIKNCNG
jgi:hypothetical protein